LQEFVADCGFLEYDVFRPRIRLRRRERMLKYWSVGLIVLAMVAAVFVLASCAEKTETPPEDPPEEAPEKGGEEAPEKGGEEAPEKGGEEAPEKGGDYDAGKNS
jgi:hypothetical protein